MNVQSSHFKGNLLKIAITVSLLLVGAITASRTVTVQGVVHAATAAATTAAVPAQQSGSLTDAAWQTKFSQSLDIHLLAKFDSSGPDAWDWKAHPNVFITTEGPGYGGFVSKVTTPGLMIVDAYTYQVVATQHYDLGIPEYFESHGLGVSPDGKWIYIPTGDTKHRAAGDAGRILIINAKTLKVDTVLSTKSMPHHFKSYTTPEGKGMVLGEDFNWQAPAFGVRPGSGIYVFDPSNDNRVVGGINADTLQANPYLAFASPKGDFVYIGLPPGAINDRDITHHLEGTWAVVDTKTWEPVKYFVGGFDPIWTAFTSDGAFAFLCDGGSSEVFKVDTSAKKVVAKSNASTLGGYGCHLGWDETRLWVIGKGEASHNRGKEIGLVDAKLMTPLDVFVTNWIRADHGTLMPDPSRNELWVTSNSSFEVVVWNMDQQTVTKRIPTPNGGSTHSGSFVWYKPDGTGEVLSDQNGTHFEARDAQTKIAAAAAAGNPAPELKLPYVPAHAPAAATGPTPIPLATIPSGGD